MGEARKVLLLVLVVGSISFFGSSWYFDRQAVPASERAEAETQRLAQLHAAPVESWEDAEINEKIPAIIGEHEYGDHFIVVTAKRSAIRKLQKWINNQFNVLDHENRFDGWRPVNAFEAIKKHGFIDVAGVRIGYVEAVRGPKTDVWVPYELFGPERSVWHILKNIQGHRYTDEAIEQAFLDLQRFGVAEIRYTQADQPAIRIVTVDE